MTADFLLDDPPGATGNRWAVALPAGMELLNENQRLHWGKRSRLVAAIRNNAGWAARRARIPRLEKAHIVYVVHPSPRLRRRDPGNWAPSAKAAVDGLVDAGVLEDDNSTRLTGPDPRLGEPVPESRLVLHIWELVSPGVSGDS